MKKLAKIIAAIALIGMSTFFTSSCATNQGHGSQGYRDSQTAVQPAWQRALNRSRRHR